MHPSANSILTSIALIASLAMCPVAPEAGNILFLASGAIGLALMWPDATRHASRPIIWMPLAGIGLIGVAYLTSAGLAGLGGLAYFAPLQAILPLTTLFDGAQKERVLQDASVLALCGAAGAAAIAAFEIGTTDVVRAGEMVANPIHFADVALLVGFMATAGMIAIAGPWRYAFLVAPLLALLAVVLSGTRGALVAFVAMAFTGLICAAMQRLIPRRTLYLTLAGLVAGLVVALIIGASHLPALQRMISDLTDALLNGAGLDASSALRMQMYLGGFRAFLESPLIGHGPLAFTSVADGLADVSFGGAPHLHNDLVDMAASAGILGLVAYALFVLAPLVEICRGSHRPGKAASVVLIVTLVAGFVVMGLTNAMFGILTVTITFAIICVLAGLLASTSAERNAGG